MKDKLRRKATLHVPMPRIFFTYEQLILLLQALGPLESYLAKPHIQPINMELATKVITNLQTKFQRLHDEQRWNTDVPMDANEVLMVQGALTAFWLRLHELPPSQERAISLKNCSSLLQQFNLVAATLPSK